MKKFQHKCDIHEEWSEGKVEHLKTNFEKCSLNDLRALSRQHMAFESDLSAHQDRVEQIAAIAHELNSLRYDRIQSINERCQKICNEWDELGDLTQNRRRLLTDAERIAERIDSLFLDYAKKAAPYLNWLDGAREDLVDMFFIHTLDEICGKTTNRFGCSDRIASLGLMEAHKQFKATLDDANKEYESIMQIVDEVAKICKENHLDVPANPYTNISAEVISSSRLRFTFIIDGLVSRKSEVNGRK